MSLIIFLFLFIQAHPEVASEYSLELSKKTSLEGQKPYKVYINFINHIKPYKPYKDSSPGNSTTGLERTRDLTPGAVWKDKYRDPEEMESRVDQLVDRGHFPSQRSCPCVSPKWDGTRNGLGVAVDWHWDQGGREEQGLQRARQVRRHLRRPPVENGLKAEKTVRGYWLHMNLNRPAAGYQRTCWKCDRGGLGHPWASCAVLF